MTATLDRAAIAEVLGAIPLFTDLAPDLLAMVAAEATARRVPAGTVLFEMGDDGEEMFAVARGLVQIVLPGPSGTEEVVAELGDGRWFGEMALITGEPRSAAARVTVDTELLLLSRASFHSLLARMPVLALRLSQELSRRLRARLVAASAGPAHHLVVLEDAADTAESGAGASVLAAAIAEELGASIAYVDLGSGTRGRADVRLEPHPWRELADVDRLRRSHAAVVMRVPRGHPLGESVRALPGVRVDTSPLTVDPVNGSPASGILATPLQQRARRLIGRRIGLVLGAGGAKGLAHVGAIRSFERAGLRFDMLAGTSMGAIIATLSGLGWSSDRMEELAERVRRNFRAMLVDIGLSGSLLRGAKKRALLAELV